MTINDKQQTRSGDAFNDAVGAVVARGMTAGIKGTAGIGRQAPGGTPDMTRETGMDADPVALDDAWRRAKAKLRINVGEDIYVSWFGSMEFERFDGVTVHVSAPTKFLKNWIQSHYADALLDSCKSEFKTAERMNVLLRQPGGSQSRSGQPLAVNGTEPGHQGREEREEPRRVALNRVVHARYGVNGGGGQNGPGAPFEGSPLDPRYTFDSFVIGSANRLAHAAAKQVAETVLDQPLRFNPLYIHSSVGMGKTHLLHAVAWDVKRRHPNAQVLYLTAERFRYHFVGAVMAQDPLTFKDKFRSMDLLLIDDLEFMQGPKTEQEFDHTLNMLLDAGRQVVVASARAPVHLESLDMRMRSRLAGGLVTEIGGLDYDLRLSILEKRVAEKRANDPSFEIGKDVLEFLAERLTESGRELEGAVTRLYAACHYIGDPITVESAEHIVKDLMHGSEPRRIKIEDILRVVSKHFGVPRSDILSQRRHRSVVWPRQIGMYLSKQLTSRSLPEIGRRFGNRDHTTVLHAIRKIDNELKANIKLRDELEDLKRLLNN